MQLPDRVCEVPETRKSASWRAFQTNRSRIRHGSEKIHPQNRDFEPTDQAAPAMYRATRPHEMHLSVTCECGVGGMIDGDRSIFPEQEGQLRGEPVRSLAIKCSACAGLYVAGRGLRMTSSKNCILDLYAKTADVEN